VYRIQKVEVKSKGVHKEDDRLPYNYNDRSLDDQRRQTTL